MFKTQIQKSIGSQEILQIMFIARLYWAVQVIFNITLDIIAKPLPIKVDAVVGLLQICFNVKCLLVLFCLVIVFHHMVNRKTC
jgi:hypothetical protein